MNLPVPGIRPKNFPTCTMGQMGFTLVEVLMVVILLGVSLALAVPTYEDFAEKRQLTNATEQIASFVNATQGIANLTNQAVTVSYLKVDDTAWCVGAVIGPVACDCTKPSTDESDSCSIDGELFVLNNSHASSLNLISTVNGDGAYTFDPVRGVFLDKDDAMELELRSGSDDFRLNVQVNNLGHVTTCSDNVTHAVPGYGICSQEIEEEI